MTYLTKLEDAQEAYKALCNLCDPDAVKQWIPTEDERAEFLRLSDLVVLGIDQLRNMEHEALLRHASVQSFVPELLFNFVRDHVGPRRRAIRAAQDLLDPKGDLWRAVSELPERFHTGTRVRNVFLLGVERVEQLLDDNPDIAEGYIYDTDAAAELLDSRLINFMPDDWLHRASELSPIRVVNQNLELPGHVRLRLEELFRTYIFGAFISVLALSRSILEYAILDNLHKFRLDAKWPADRSGRQREKKLSDLVDELGELLPDLLPRLEHLRNLGNEYIHPKKTQTSKESLLQRRENSRTAVRLAHELVQFLYRYKREV